MEVLNQTWEKIDGQMVLVHEERVQVPGPVPTLEQRVKKLEDKQKELDLAL